MYNPIAVKANGEHDHVLERFGKTDTEVLRDFGLLGEKAVMAHCNFIDEKMVRSFVETGTAVAHCPISNAYFANGVIPINRLKEQGVTIGLGTDISGGFSPSLYDNIKQSCYVFPHVRRRCGCYIAPNESRCCECAYLSHRRFSLATKGGGEALRLPIGLIKEGYACDLQSDRYLLFW